MLDLPQLYQKPSASLLLSTLAELSLAPLSWDDATLQPPSRKPAFDASGLPDYLTRIVGSSLAWIEDPDLQEKVWEAASQRLSERSGRSGMGAMTRSFRIPLDSDDSSSARDDDSLEIVIHEPALTEDNLGLKTWAASYLLAKRLTLLRATLSHHIGVDQILELGSGTGLVGMAAAAIFSTHVVLTDLPEIVENLELNLRANETSIADGGGSAETAVLDWCHPSNLCTATSVGSRPRPVNSFPLILVADPIYSPEHPRLLVDAIREHLSQYKHAHVVIELPLRAGYSNEREDLARRMSALGLVLVGSGVDIGYDDWGNGTDGELAEVECGWYIWGWPG